MQAKDIVTRYKNLRDERDSYDDLRQKAADYVNPRRYDLNGTHVKGLQRGTKSYDSAPQRFLDIWVDGMQGFMVSKSIRWFRSVLSGPARLVKQYQYLPEVVNWLQEYDEQLYYEYRRSNFYQVLPEYFRDAGSIGTSTMFMEEDLKTGFGVFTVVHPREVYIAEDCYGRVDTVYRLFEMTARQMVQKFGDKCPDLVRQQAGDPESAEERHELIHAVFPNDEYMFGSILPESKKWASAYVYYGVSSTGGKTVVSKPNQEIIRKSGFDYFPFAVWRYRKNSDEVYGYSQAMDAINDVLSLNNQARVNLKAGHLAVEGPVNVPKELAGEFDINPGGVNYFDDPQRLISPVRDNIRLPWGIEQQDRLEKSLREWYNVDLFMMLAHAEREMTATEIVEKQGEKFVLMGPKVDRLHTEGLIPCHEMIQNIAYANGRLPQAPDVLFELFGEGEITLEFTGPLAQAQRQYFESRGIESGLQKLGMIAQMYPKVLHKVKDLALAERVLMTSGFDPDLLNSDETVEAVVNQQNQLAQMQMMVEMADKGAGAASKLQKKTEEGSPLEALVGQS